MEALDVRGGHLSCHFIQYELYKDHDIGIVLMALCLVDTGPLTLRTYTIFMSTLQKPPEFLSIYISMKIMNNNMNLVILG